jgi:hypothetical protein
MDEAAKDYLRRLIDSDAPPAPSEIAFEGWSCWVNGVKTTTDPSIPVLRAVHEDSMKTHLARPDHLRMTKEGFQAVDWVATGDAMRGFPRLFRMWASKHNSRFCGVGRMQKICGFWDHSRCPCCDCDNETTSHLFVCPQDGARMTWDDGVELLEQWMNDVDTRDEIVECIITTLKARDPTVTFASNATHNILEAAEEQDTIGWQNFLEGKISKQWRELQEQHYNASFSVRSGDKWATDMVTRLLEFTHDIWEYRNSVCHERAANGLKRKEAEALEQDILEEFALDVTNLSRRDQHYIRRGLQDVQAMSASDKQAWLRGVRIARKSSVPNSLRRQRSMMDTYFSISST